MKYMERKPNNSPFFVVKEFFSPLECEMIIDREGLFTPNKDIDLMDTSMIRTTNQLNTELITNRIKPIIPKLEQHYQFDYKGLRPPKIEWYPANVSAPIDTGSFSFIQGKWVRTGVDDFTGVIFLKDYQDQPPIDEEFECYGGKLQMANHNFSFNPNRGTLIFFPADMRFLNQFTTSVIGDNIAIRFRLVAQDPWLYNPTSFPGNYQTWF